MTSRGFDEGVALTAISAVLLDIIFLQKSAKLSSNTFHAIRAEGRTSNNWTMVSVVSLCRRSWKNHPAKSTVVLEPVERDLSILADFDEVPVRITHVAAPFPAMII